MPPLVLVCGTKAKAVDGRFFSKRIKVDVPQVFLGSVNNLLVLFLAVAGVWKLFQIAADMRELKEVLKRRSDVQTFSPPPPVPGSTYSSGPLSPEDLVRAVHAQSFDDGSPVFELPALDPVVLPPGTKDI
jgi:hypothetical protein